MCRTATVWFVYVYKFWAQTYPDMANVAHAFGICFSPAVFSAGYPSIILACQEPFTYSSCPTSWLIARV